MKTCGHCLQSLPVENFHRRRDQHDHRCKACASTARSAARKAHPDRFRALESKRDREASLARSAVRYEIRTGRLTKQPCFICGESTVEAHHPAYSMPLDVTWLCIAHHKQLHHEHVERLRRETAGVNDTQQRAAA